MIIAILAIENDHVFWPDAAEKSVIAREFEDRGVPGGCVGCVDGFSAVLATKPRRMDAADFASYKGGWGFNIMGVCDHQKKIRYVQCGWTGGTHDNRVFASSSLYTRSRDFFSNGQFLLADSAYTPETFCVPLFTTGRGNNGLAPGEVKSHKVSSHTADCNRAETLQ